MKILIVDDIKENLYLLETLLKGSGYEVVTAKDGLEALAKLKEESIDLIISDILMPQMDGFQFCRECKKDDSLKKIPFIFYTATYTDKKDEEFVLSLGADRFILKPQEPEIFLKILKEVIEEHKKGAYIAPKEPIKEEEIYFERYSKRLVHKLEKKMLDLQKANKILQEKEERLYNLNQFQENVIHNANVWIDVLDEKANVVIWNEAAERMSGYSAAEVIGNNKIWGWLYPDEKYRKKITTKVNAIIEKREAAEDFETRISCKDGKVKIISWHSRNLTNPQGKIIGSVALGRDITLRQQAVEALKESEERYHTVFENTGTATNVIEEDMTIIMVNTQFEKLSGYSKEEIVNKMKGTDFIISEELEEIKNYHIARRKNGEQPPTDYEIRFKDRAGNIKDVFVRIGRIPNTGQSIASLTDITERKQWEKDLRESEKKYRLLFEILNEGIWRIDAKECTTFVNPKMAQMLGYSVKEMEGKHLFSFIDNQLVNTAKENIKRRQQGVAEQHEFTFRKKSGELLHVLVNTSSLSDEQGNYIGALESITDITSLKQAEEKLKKTMDATLATMSKIVEVKDPYTAGHQQRVSQLTTAIAKELNLSQDKVEGIRIASLIYDIGKISVPTEILSKSTTLSDIEFSLIKEHSRIGYEILKAIDFSYPVANIILQHHEKINGSGYPGGLKGDEILLEAKIICVADVVEAMSSHRPYRPALGIDKTLEEISQNRGTLYDPEVVDICLKLFKEKEFKF